MISYEWRRWTINCMRPGKEPGGPTSTRMSDAAQDSQPNGSLSVLRACPMFLPKILRRCRKACTGQRTLILRPRFWRCGPWCVRSSGQGARRAAARQQVTLLRAQRLRSNLNRPDWIGARFLQRPSHTRPARRTPVPEYPGSGKGHPIVLPVPPPAGWEELPLDRADR
jgi:hypothetical protein